MGHARVSLSLGWRHTPGSLLNTCVVLVHMWHTLESYQQSNKKAKGQQLCPQANSCATVQHFTLQYLRKTSHHTVMNCSLL